MFLYPSVLRPFEAAEPVYPTWHWRYFAASASRQWFRKAVRSRGMIFSAFALVAQSRCLICSARRFSAASRCSGATVVGSTSFWAKPPWDENRQHAMAAANAVRFLIMAPPISETCDKTTWLEKRLGW